MTVFLDGTTNITDFTPRKRFHTLATNTFPYVSVDLKLSSLGVDFKTTVMPTDGLRLDVSSNYNPLILAGSPPACWNELLPDIMALVEIRKQYFNNGASPFLLFSLPMSYYLSRN